MKAKFISDYLNEAFGQKDLVRMQDIRTKAAGDEDKEIALAATQAKLISKGEKAAARAEAAVDVFGMDHPVTKIFQERTRELGASRGSASKGVLAPVKGPAGKGERLEREFKRNQLLPSERIKTQQQKEVEKGGGFHRGGDVMGRMGLGRFAQPEETTDEWVNGVGSILPIGWVDLGSGESKYLNAKRNGGIAEVWETRDGKFRLILNSSDEPGYKIGTRKDFRHDQTWKHLGTWRFIDYIPTENLMELTRVYGAKMPGYVYK